MSGCIGLAGVGGIGSNVAVNLVRSGVTRLKLVDMDVVEQSNLNRQFYFTDQIGLPKVAALAENLRRINPQLQLETLQLKLEPANCCQVFADCPVMVEGVDGAATKKMLLEQFADKALLVSASGIAGPGLADLRRRRLGNCVVAGDFVSDCAGAVLYAHKLQAVCALMTEEILHWRNRK